MSRLNFGAFLAPHHPIGEHPMLQFRRDLDLVEHLDKLGYEEFWCGEHHSSGWEMIASPEMFLAAAAERTKRIKLATGVVRGGITDQSVRYDSGGEAWDRHHLDRFAVAGGAERVADAMGVRGSRRDEARPDRGPQELARAAELAHCGDVREGARASTGWAFPASQ